MSEMQGVEKKQAETTKGIAATTGAVKGVQSTIADGDRSVSAKLSMIGKVLSIESPAEKAARQQSQAQASASAENFQRLIQLQAQGNATEQQVLEAQRSMESTAEEAAEAAEKRSMFDRFGGDEAPTPPPSGGGGGEDKETKKTGGVFGKFFKMIKGFVGILLAIAIPALALILNSPIFEKLKEAIFDFIDFFFKEILPVINSILDNIMPNIKNLFVSVKKIFNSISDFFTNLIAGDFDKAFGNLKDIGKEFAKMIDNSLTALVKIVLGAFGVNVDKEFTVFGIFKTFFKKIVDFIEAIVRSLPFGGAVADKFFGKQDAKDMSKEDRVEETGDAEKEVKGLTQDINRQKNKQKELAEEKVKLEKEIAEDEKKLLERGENLTAKNKMGETVRQRNLRNKKERLEATKKNQERAKTEESELKNEQNKLVERLDKVADPERQLAAQAGVEGIDLDEEEGRKVTTRNERLGIQQRNLRKEIKAAAKETERAAEISAQAANDNKGSTVVVQQNDQSQKSNTEQKTVIEQNKTLQNPAAGGALARASEGFM